MDKRFKRESGHCPICSKGLAKSKKELLDTLGFDTTQQLELTEKDIKDAFKVKAREHHPDKPSGNPEMFQEIKDAKEELLEILREEGIIPTDPLSIDPLGSVMSQPKTMQDIIQETPSPTQIHHIKETIQRIRATRSAGGPCPYCKQK
jgi:DNA repair exonuclease SbcCD ATPase subunit